MATVLFDTLALARKLEAAGFPSRQAQDTAAALAESLGQDMLTRRDLGEAMAGVRAELREVDTNLRAEMKELEIRLATEIKNSEHRMTIRLGTMMGAGIALVAALVKLF